MSEERERLLPRTLWRDRLRYGINGKRNLERAMWKEWRKINLHTDYVSALISRDVEMSKSWWSRVWPFGNPTWRDRMIALTIIQWLGTNATRTETPG